jgi:imidazolonepropionase-like amidohydrolase
MLRPLLLLLSLAVLIAAPMPAAAQQSRVPAVLFENVRVFDGRADYLSAPVSVLVTGNRIERVGAGPLALPTDALLTRIDGAGRTLMPGLIDAHTHLMFMAVQQIVALTADVGYLNLVAGRAAGDMLMRGFTSVRDMGGPTYGLKRAIDQGVIPGPRIWPSGAMISQSGGHGDFRLPNELPARAGELAYSERVNASMIADSPDEVRKRVREQLALGASQVKLHAGGGVASVYDPLDVTQYSVPEIRAAVEAAENWGTYVAVHAYTPRAIGFAVDAGVKVIEHGQLLDEATARLLAERGVWLCLQPFLDDSDANPYPEGSPNRAKQLQMMAGTETAYRLARQYRLKTAFGTDMLNDPQRLPRQGAQLVKLARWYAPAEVLRIATSANAELLALSGPRNPYPGRLGVVEEGALADLLLVDGDPLADIRLIEDPDQRFVVIMKDGRIYKNTLR